MFPVQYILELDFEDGGYGTRSDFSYSRRGVAYTIR
jgi:hypothetical protein